MSRVYFHGNNKTPDELEYALEVGCGRIVVDSFYELRLLNDLARERGATPGHPAAAVAQRGSAHPRRHDHRHPRQ